MLYVPALVPPLVNSNGVLQCGHGGMFPLIPKGLSPIVGGAPGIKVTDLPGTIAAGCVFNVLGAVVPCVIVSATAGICTTVNYGGTPAVHQGLVCATSNGVPSIPMASAGQMAVQGV